MSRSFHMSKTASAFELYDRANTPAPAFRRIPVVPLGLSLASFFAVTFVLCVLFDLWFPALAMNPVWAPLLPGFVWISWSGFFLGLAEVFAYGWYIALVFGPLYNFFARRAGTPAQT
ncbi:hypothetical protein MNBD_ALPHA09-1712 [hydrothermal vent metagenome]|uniref:Uncharacterized protein n=1 Tax=hydrothermal vent metagenome TaxID=652676 RepID=A0A3B0TVE7_9ZZZZ